MGCYGWMWWFEQNHRVPTTISFHFTFVLAKLFTDIYSVHVYVLRLTCKCFGYLRYLCIDKMLSKIFLFHNVARRIQVWCAEFLGNLLEMHECDVKTFMQRKEKMWLEIHVLWSRNEGDVHTQFKLNAGEGKN